MVFNLSETNTGGGGGEWTDISDAFSITQYSEQMPRFGTQLFLSNGSIVIIYLEIAEPSTEPIYIRCINSTYAPRLSGQDMLYTANENDGTTADIWPFNGSEEDAWSGAPSYEGTLFTVYQI